MPSSDPNAKNAAGLTPTESRSLSERQPEQHEQTILAAIKDLYTCNPTENSYQVYAPDAVFHDPVGIAKGADAIRAQFNGLVKLFPRADIGKFRVLENPKSVPKGTILVDQDVSYFRDPKAAEPTKTVNSLLTLHTNSSNQITEHFEEWDHKRETDSSDGFLGYLNESRKKLTASITDMLVGKEPPKKS
ncbi:hypothetical protein NEOLEDRAFT_1083587 [Neolentinus lepideus HHB14362 ss-1]|uniref:SnoaL-like domain-containing protein n=1 Tax=Neolentinus lepideus HHB14362 ss-1 TaxID=1314782 RepID=A0A165WC81_9AGAM|nr:hypothetical protein NEOLEDRAFT_1083587 [Neolentinus lepideus HHB14362 ss-1]